MRRKERFERVSEKKEWNGLKQEQVMIIGAGPCGLSVGVELKKAGIDALLIDKGPLVHSIYRYPTYLVFHSTPERLEIGDIPFVTPNEKPTRLEALTYYRTVAERYQLRIHPYEEVHAIAGRAGAFRVSSTDRHGEQQEYVCKQVVIATGYFDNPNRLGVPGEGLPKVHNRYTEAHPYAGMKVAIVGANNSAVDAALELQRAGAEVTVISRKPELSSHVKAWTRPVFESKVNQGLIRMLYSARVVEIAERWITVERNGERERLENDFVLTLIGFRPDRKLLLAAGVRVDEETDVPVHDPETMETNVPGIYLAGVIAAGKHANAIFIENGRHHGKLIAEHIKQQADRC